MAFRLQVSFGLLAVLALCASAGCKKDKTEDAPNAPPSFKITFLFNNVAGLEKGSKVSVRGKEAGEVVSVEMKGRVEVTAEIRGELRGAVRTECYGRAETSTVGSSTLVIVILDPESEPIGDGETREGATSMVESAEIETKFKMGQLAKGAGEALKEGAQATKEALKGGAAAAKKAAGKAGEVAREGAAAAKEKAGAAAGKAKDALKGGWDKAKNLNPF